MKILDLGCGNDKYKSKNDVIIGIDNAKIPGVDIIHTSHTLEHLNNLDEVFQELIRITKNRGRIKIRVPHFSCGVSYRDPTHKKLFSYFSFDYFTDECFYTKSKFKIVNRKLNFTRKAFIFLNYIFNPIINLSPLLYERFFCWILPCAEVIAELEVRK